MIKDIVINLGPGSTKHPAEDYALSMAQAFEAHVAAVAVTYDIVVPGTMLGEGFAMDLVEAHRRDSEQAAQASIERFERAAKLAGVSTDNRILRATLADVDKKFARLARVFGVAVLAQPEPDKDPASRLIVEGAIFDSGRPVVVVPYIQKEGMTLDRVTVCWDGSRSSTRAVAAAIPFLRKSKKVEVLTVSEPPKDPTVIPGADIAQHLARLGINVEASHLPSSGITVAEAIQSHIADSGSNLVVMGGYGHSWLRETLLGGVTREMLQAMLAPTLMMN